MGRHQPAIYTDDNNDVSNWDNNDLTDTNIIHGVRDVDDGETRTISDDESPLDIDDYYDDHETTQIIAEGDDTTITFFPKRMGAAGRRAMM